MSADHSLATPSDPHGYMGTVLAVQRLKMRQAITFEAAWSILLQGEHSPDAMPQAGAERTRGLLKEFDYREYVVTPVDGGDSRSLWIRPDWPTERLEWVPFE